MKSQARLEALASKRTLERRGRMRNGKRANYYQLDSTGGRDYVSESTILSCRSDDAMKGGSSGGKGATSCDRSRNRIDLISRDSEAVIVSGFDPLRRESPSLARRLMHDGRIHPTRIEEIVEKVKVYIDKLMYDEAGKSSLIGLSDFHPS